MSCSWGDTLRVEIFGASHAAAVGVTARGLPAGESVDLEALQRFLERRAPGQSALSTARKETDRPRFVSGLQDGALDGAPLTALIDNGDRRSADYEQLRDVPRPGHADYTARVKYGADFDMRGGGPFSGRMTAPLCVAGGICLQLLARRGVRVAAHIAEIGGVADAPFDPMGADEKTLDALGARELPVLDPEAGERMRAAILAAAAEGDSLGGVVECMVTGLPAGLGGPLFEGLEGKLAAMIFAIPAVKGADFGAGFGAARLRGSENNDAFRVKDGEIVTKSNRAGGVLGGISNGMPLLFRAAFKPTPSIAKPQQSVKLSMLEETELVVSGRHDPCIVPRAVPVVEAAAAIVLLDALLTEENDRAKTRDLAALRGEIDRIDAALAPLLAERMGLSDEVGRFKRERGLPVLDAEREQQLLSKIRGLAGEESADSVEAVYRAILAASRARQEETP